MNTYERNVRRVDLLTNPEKLTPTEGYRYWYRSWRKFTPAYGMTHTPGYSQAEKAYEARCAPSGCRSSALKIRSFRAHLKYRLNPHLVAAWFATAPHIVGKRGDCSACPIAEYLFRTLGFKVRSLSVYKDLVVLRAGDPAVDSSLRADAWLAHFIGTIDSLDHDVITREDAIAALESAFSQTQGEP